MDLWPKAFSVDLWPKALSEAMSQANVVWSGDLGSDGANEAANLWMCPQSHILLERLAVDIADETGKIVPRAVLCPATQNYFSDGVSGHLPEA